jgi:hypothetical protein
MANKTSIKGEIVLEYLKRFPKLPSLTLSRKIYNENKETFTTLDAVRSIVRRFKGQSGEKARKDLTNRNFITEAGSRNPFAWIPDSHTDHANTWRLPSQFKKVLLVSDVHVPYHDIKAVKCALEYAKKQGVDCVYINGDLLDFHGLSFHEKDRRKRPSIADELKMGRDFLKGLREYMGCAVYYKPANHEHRLERYLVVKAPELLDCEEFRLDVLLRLGELKINYINRRDKCYFGHLLVEHGDRIKGTGGVNPAQTLYRRYKRHAICGHFHKKTEFSAKVYDGNSIVTYSVGSLCELEPEYFEVNEHVHGFAIVNMDGDEFRVQNFTIENGKVY